jgi:hypothetical protein
MKILSRFFYSGIKLRRNPETMEAEPSDPLALVFLILTMPGY